MKKYKSSLHGAFKNAFKAFPLLVQERNFRIHLLATILVALAGFYFEVTRIEWIVLCLCIGSVLTAEAFNSAIELLCDRVTIDEDQAIGKIKDIAAAAVLISAVMSAIVGALIFLPRIL